MLRWTLRLFFVLFFPILSWANSFTNNAPDCYSRNQIIPIDNEQVLDWKYHSKDQYKNRGNVLGVLTLMYRERSGHYHFQVTIGDNPQDTIEVIYNKNFGEIPREFFQLGALVQACGDYITSNKRTKRYQPSPDGALIHWVHRSNNDRHEHGFVVINDQLFGY